MPLVFLLFLHLVVRAQPEAGFLIKFRDEITPHSITGVFVLPGEVLRIQPLLDDENARIEVAADSGSLTKVDKHWEWEAPETRGVYQVTITNLDTDIRKRLNCIVMASYNDLTDQRLNGYRIGTYPNSSNELYKLPRGFIEVTEANENTKVSPHYILKDFLCKQAGGYPKYVVLKERGILKLEIVQAHLKSLGYDFEKFSFISGYRTPYYNKSIGNVKFSRHVFGDAFDVFIDKNGDFRMDDLNDDGSYDKKDVQYLYQSVDKLFNQPWYKPFIGGLGLYGPNSRRPAFIHIDSRGYRARWGK